MHRDGVVLDEKKMPKEIYNWLIDEALEFHEGNEEIMNKVTGKESRSDYS